VNFHVRPYRRLAAEVTRLILDSHDAAAFQPVSHLTVGSFREWFLSHEVTSEVLTRVAPAITPEMAAAVSKLMRLQHLALVARKCRVVTRFRNTLGLPGRTLDPASARPPAIFTLSW
jgi:ethanolamine ammonia-lyase large subunit